MRITKFFAFLRLLCLATLLASILPAQAQNTCQSRPFNAYEENVSAAYIAYYGRPADTGGLAYWAEQLISQNGNLGAIIDAFGNSAEYRQRFGSLSNRELIRNLYQQLYGRDPDQGGWLFYEMWLDTGVQSLASIAISILAGTEGSDVAILNNRKAVAQHFITSMEALGSDAPTITDGNLLANLIAATDGSAVSLEDACAQINTLIKPQSTTTAVLSMSAHEVGSSGAINNLSGSVNSERYFKLTVPAGVTDLVIRTSRGENGMGDADLRVSRNVRPTLESADCFSATWFSSDEECSFAAPVAGDYFIMLRGYIIGYSGVTLSASWRGSTLPPEVEVLTGYLYDSAVTGVQYRSCGGNTTAKCLEGLTGLSGEFKYTQGQQVEFLIGGLRIGVAQGQQLVTPDKLANGDAGVALQIAQLLQSLDEDQDPSNGIVIPESVRSLAVGAYPNGQDVRFVNNSQVLSNLAPGRALVSMTQVGAHATGAALLDVMLANNSTVISKAILGTQNYLTTGKINYESLNTNVHARLRLALFNKKMMEEKGLLAILQRRGASITELEDDVKAWMRDIEVVKSYGDSAMAVLAILDSRDPAVIVEAFGTFAAFGNKVLLDEGSSLTDAQIESIKAATLHGAGMLDANPKKLLMSYLEALKATSSAGDLPVFKKSIESVQFGVECLNAFLDKTDKDFERFDNVYQCVAGGTELIAKGIVESAATGQLIITDQVAQVHGAAYDFLQAYYQSAGNPIYMREKYGMDFHKPSYDAQKMLNLDPTILTHVPIAGEVESAINFAKLVAYQYIISKTMAEIDRETELYAQVFNLKYAGLLDLKAAGIANGSVVPVGTAVDFEATFKNMSAGSYTVRSINWLATGGGAPTVVATGTRANVRFNSAGTYSVAAHAEVLLPDGKTYFMVDTFTVAVQDAIPVPTLTLTATPGDGYVDLSWNAIPGATSYMVHMTAGVVGPEGPPSIGTTAATSYRVNGLQNGALHRFTVRAFRNAEVIVGSGLASATPQGPVGELIAGRYLPIDGGAVIRDTVNGLEWQRCSVGQTWNGATQRCDGVAATYNWDQAIQLTAAGGFRIPTIAELKTLVYCSSGQPKLFGPLAARDCSGNFSQPTIVQAAFPNTLSSGVWSGSPDAGNSNGAWGVNFYDGNANYYGLRNGYAHVRLVRGQPSSPSLIAGRYLPIDGGAVIRDTVNGLEWQRCSVGQTWNGTTQRCDGTAAYTLDQATQLTAAGGFRIPTIAELKTLVYCSSGQPKLFGPLDDDVSCSGNYSRPTVAQAAFPNTRSSPVWSGSPYAWYSGGPIGAWLVDFRAGKASGNDNRNANYPVRLVRGGQSFASLPIRSANLASVNAASLPVKASPGVLGTALANFTGYDGAAPDAPVHSAQFNAASNWAFFLSRATNLLPGAQGSVQHLYRLDAASRTLRRLSQAPSGEAANADTTAFSLAAEAGKLVFRTQASNLEGGPGLYLLDLETGTRRPLLTALQHGGSDPGADNPVLGTTAQGLAFDAPDAAGRLQVFTAALDESGLHDLRQETPIDGQSIEACCAALSGDGRYLAWQEVGHDGRVLARVLDLASDKSVTIDWPHEAATGQVLRLALSENGALLHWLAMPDTAENAAPLHGVANPLFVSKERLH